jgi:hypothetical protein
MMAASLRMRTWVREKAPPVVFRRGWGWSAAEIAGLALGGRGVFVQPGGDVTHPCDDLGGVVAGGAGPAPLHLVPHRIDVAEQLRPGAFLLFPFLFGQPF